MPPPECPPERPREPREKAAEEKGKEQAHKKANASPEWEPEKSATNPPSKPPQPLAPPQAMSQVVDRTKERPFPRDAREKVRIQKLDTVVERAPFGVDEPIPYVRPEQELDRRQVQDPVSAAAKLRKSTKNSQDTVVQARMRTCSRHKPRRSPRPCRLLAWRRRAPYHARFFQTPYTSIRRRACAIGGNTVSWRPFDRPPQYNRPTVLIVLRGARLSASWPSRYFKATRGVK